jgi:hypothetical protein
MTGQIAAELAANDQDTRSHPVRTSHLKQMGRSAAHCRHAILNDYEPTLPMRLGKGCHSLLLGGPPVLLCPTKQRRGKDYDAWLGKQEEDAIVLTGKEFRRAHAMADAVRGNKLAAQVLFAPGTIYEETIFWEQNGRKRRSTPDARTKSHMVDLKTTRDASPEKFRWDAIRMGYHVQMGDYEQAMIAQNGYAPKSVYMVAVESKEPHLCTVHKLTTGALERGAKQAREWLAALIECEQSGVWPGYADLILDFDVPLDVETDLVWDDDNSNEEDES